MALRRSAGSLALRAAASYLRHHRPHPPPPLALAAPGPTPIRRPLAPQCRHFAAPPGTQVNKKEGKEEDKGLRMNNAITAPFVRLVTDEGHDVLPRHEALQRASRMDMDLVEVDRKSDPPVCKIMDFHKEKYKKDTKEKERLKAKSAIVLRGGENKEVRFKGKTELKDLMVKADGITRLLERGYRVKCMAMPSGNGRNPCEGEDLGTPLSRLLGLIQDVCIVESGPHLDSKHAYVIVRHVKFATKKGGKKASQAREESGKGTLSAVSESPVDGSNSEHKTVGDGLGKPDDRTISDCVKKTATHLSGDSAAQKQGQDREFNREFNRSKSNPGAGGNRINSGQLGPQSSEGGLGHKDLQPGMEKRESNVQDQGPVETNRYAARRQPIRGDNNQGFNQQQIRGDNNQRHPQDDRKDLQPGMEKRESNVQDQGPVTNRYAARRQPIRGDNNQGFNQGRHPQDDRRNENRGRYDNQRPLEQQNNRPLPRFNQGGLPQDPRNERRGPFPLNNQGGDPNPASKSFGIFSSTQKSGSSEPRKPDGTSKPGNTDPPSFGIFSSRK